MRINKKRGKDLFGSIRKFSFLGFLGVFLGMAPFALAVEDEAARKWVKTGQQLFRQNDYDGAVIAFQKALGLGGKIKSAYEGLARCYEAQGDLDKALENYKIAQGLKEDAVVVGDEKASQPQVRQEETSFPDKSENLEPKPTELSRSRNRFIIEGSYSKVFSDVLQYGTGLGLDIGMEFRSDDIFQYDLILGYVYRDLGTFYYDEYHLDAYGNPVLTTTGRRSFGEHQLTFRPSVRIASLYKFIRPSISFGPYLGCVIPIVAPAYAVSPENYFDMGITVGTRITLFESSSFSPYLGLSVDFGLFSTKEFQVRRISPLLFAGFLF